MDSALLSGLNESQRAAVTCIEGPLLMLAGPGSGKTRVVTHRIAYMLEQGIAPESILALTFTNKAAEEMRHRLERLVGDAPLWMGTFHGFCVRLLRRYSSLLGLPPNFSIYDTDDSELALKAAVAEADFSLTHVTLGGLANRISYYKNRLVTPETLIAEGLSSEEHHIARVYPFYQRQLLKNGAVDFDDLLMHTATLLRSHPEVRQQLDERYRYLMVDEYQDTNLAQYVIVRHLAIDYPNLAVTGDPDQSIYGWRGANLKNVSYLERDYPATRVIRLEDNYRSTPEILSVADCLIQHNQYRKPKRLVASRPSGAAVRLCVYPTARREAEEIVNAIAAGVAAGERSLRDFAILYRTNAQSRLLEQSLVRCGLPYQLIGGFRFYMRKEVKDLVSYLLLLNNPDDDVAFERVINTPPRGVGKQSLAKLKQIAAHGRSSLLDATRRAVKTQALGKKILKGLENFLGIYDTLTGMLHGSLQALIEATLERTEYRKYVLAGQDPDAPGERDALANLNELLAEAAELDATPLEGTALEAFLEYAALHSDTDRLKSGSEAVTLMTLHAAKGLEFPVVYIIALEDNILPHSRSRDDALAVEEERRLLFVGITRAQDQLQLSYALRRGFGDQDSPSIPSSFLVELPRGDMIWTDLTEHDWYGDDAYGGDHDDYAQAAQLWDDDYSQLDHPQADSQLEDSQLEDSQLEDSQLEDSQLEDQHDVDAIEYAADEDSPARMRNPLRLKRSRQRAGKWNRPDASESQADYVIDATDSQLPADEIPERMLHKFRGRLVTAAQLAAPADDVAAGAGGAYAAFTVGRVVSHPKYGSGRIIAASGRGPKRSVTIDFFSSGERRTFVVSHVQLTLEEAD
jgi:DNA helicase II / ATP-dependent DNA helicase PcrA